jgi:hypothetical protein
MASSFKSFMYYIKLYLTTAACKLVTMAAVASNPMQSTKIPDPTLDTKRPAPLNEDQSPAMIPCIAGSSGYPALLINTNNSCFQEKCFTKS